MRAPYPLGARAYCARNRGASMTDRPSQLDDRVWLARMYQFYGDRQIAKDLDVTPKRVRLARQRLGIASLPPGPRHGIAAVPKPVVDDLDATERAFRDQYRVWKRRRVPPTEQTLATAIRAAHDADREHEPHAYDAALIDIAAAAAMIHDHLQKLRRAA